MKNVSATTLLDWVTEPSSVDKKTNCGKFSQITIFVNGTVSVKAFYCHRYDCLKCGVDRRKEIVDTIMKYKPLWYAISTTESEYSAMVKRVNRAGAKYCAIGSGDKILVLTPNKVIESSELTGLAKLKNLIEDHLDCPYAYKSHIFRHSNGLFPPKPKSIMPIHIKRRYAVSKSPEVMVGELERAGYISNHAGNAESECYMRPFHTSYKPVEQLLSGMLSAVVWAEGGKSSVI